MTDKNSIERFLYWLPDRRFFICEQNNKITLLSLPGGLFWDNSQRINNYLKLHASEKFKGLFTWR